MTKLLLILGTLGCILLLGATAVLVRLNWSERLLTPLFSILLGGTVTTFITVTALLKETKIEKAAATFLVFDFDEGMPLHVFPHRDAPKQKLIKRLADTAMLGRPMKGNFYGNEISFDVERVKDEAQVQDFIGELLQLRAMLDLAELSRERLETSWSSRDGLGSPKLSVPHTLKSRQKLTGEDLAKVIDNNRFGRNPFTREKFKDSVLVLPEGASVHLEKSNEPGPPKYLIVISKPMFFRMEIAIQWRGISTELPALQNLPDDKLKQCRSYIFAITMNAKFEWITAGNRQTEDFKKWAEWLFQEIHTTNAD